MDEPLEIRFKGCRVLVWPERGLLHTVFPDGTYVPAVGNGDPDSIARARELGYGDGPAATWHMSREHEVLHTVLAEHMGEPHSPTLWAVAHHVPNERGVKASEEGRVLALQAYLRRGVMAPALAEVAGLDRLVASAQAALLPFRDGDL